MPDGAVEVQGLDDAMRDLQRWADKLDDAVADKAGPWGSRLADTVRARVPRVSGALAASVTSRETAAGVDLSLGGGLGYGGWIEFGGSRGRPYLPEGRYLTPVAGTEEDEFTHLAAQVADDTIGRFTWSTA